MRYLNLVRNVSDWPGYFAHKAGLVRRDPIAFRLRGGVAIEVPLAVLSEFKDVVFNECYTAAMPRPLTAGADIVDIGANIGAFTFLAAARYPKSRVIAFEPDPANFAQLERNAAANPGRNVVIDRRAVGARSGRAVFKRPEGKGVATSGSIFGDRRSGVVAFNVKVIGIADLFAEFGVERCGLLKLDCEGAEFRILRSAPPAVLGRIDQMVMEVHGPLEGGDNSVAGLARTLGERGFRTRPGKHRLLWAWRE